MPSLKRNFERYGINRAYFVRLGKKNGWNLSPDFEFYVVNTTPARSVQETETYDIILSLNGINGGGSKPIRELKVKRFIAPRRVLYDQFDKAKFIRLVDDPIGQDAHFLSYFGDIEVYDYIPQHNMLVMEKWQDSDKNETLEDKLISLYEFYVGGDEQQRGRIREEVKGYLSKAIELTIEHSGRATSDFQRERKDKDSGELSLDEAIFFDKNGKSKINEFPARYFKERVHKYLRAFHMMEYYIQRKLIEPSGRIISEDSEEAMRYMDRAEDFIEATYKARSELGLFSKSLSKLHTNQDKISVVHFDLRSPNILIRDGRVGFIDYEKIAYAARAIDPAIIVFDPVVNGFDIALTDRLGLLSNARLDHDEIVNSGIWALLRMSGAQSMLQHHHLGKYQTAVQKSELYDTKNLLDVNKKLLHGLLTESGAYPSISELVRIIKDIEQRWFRKTSPNESFRMRENLEKRRDIEGQHENRHNTNESNKITT